MEADTTVLATLEQVAHAQSNVLHDITALLSALQDGLERLDLPDDGDIDTLSRFAQMAKDKIAGIVGAFDPYV